MSIVQSAKLAASQANHTDQADQPHEFNQLQHALIQATNDVEKEARAEEFDASQAKEFNRLKIDAIKNASKIRLFLTLRSLKWGVPLDSITVNDHAQGYAGHQKIEVFAKVQHKDTLIFIGWGHVVHLPTTHLYDLPKILDELNPATLDIQPASKTDPKKANRIVEILHRKLMTYVKAQAEQAETDQDGGQDE